MVEGIVLAELLRRSQFDLNQRIQFYNVAYKAVVKSQWRKMQESSLAVKIIQSLRYVSCHDRPENLHAAFTGRNRADQWCACPGFLESGDAVVGNSLCYRSIVILQRPHTGLRAELNSHSSGHR